MISKEDLLKNINQCGIQYGDDDFKEMYEKIGLKEDSDINFDQYKEQLNNLTNKNYYARETGLEQLNKQVVLTRKGTTTMSNLDSKRTISDIQRNQSILLEEEGGIGSANFLSKHGSKRSILSKD